MGVLSFLFSKKSKDLEGKPKSFTFQVDEICAIGDSVNREKLSKFALHNKIKLKN